MNELRIYTDDEYRAKLRKELEEDGLYTRHEVACIIADLFGGTCACDYLEDLSNIMDSLTAEEFDNKSMEIQDKYEKKHIVIM